MKKCKKCGIEKEIMYFTKGRGVCKICWNEYMRTRRPCKKSPVKEDNKRCSKCKEEKHINYFTKNNNHCKSCKAKATNILRNVHKEGYIYNNEGYIYIIINEAWKGYIKLGRAKNVIKRLYNYQTYSPFKDYKMVFYKMVKDVGVIEQYFNNNFSHENEWFLVNQNVAINIINNIIEEFSL